MTSPIVATIAPPNPRIHFATKGDELRDLSASGDESAQAELAYRTARNPAKAAKAAAWHAMTTEEREAVYAERKVKAAKAAKPKGDRITKPRSEAQLANDRRLGEAAKARIAASKVNGAKGGRARAANAEQAVPA